jgi:hypothetical protein
MMIFVVFSSGINWNKSMSRYATIITCVTCLIVHDVEYTYIYSIFTSYTYTPPTQNGSNKSTDSGCVCPPESTKSKQGR